MINETSCRAVPLRRNKRVNQTPNYPQGSLRKQEAEIQNFLFIGGSHDGLNVTVAPDQKTVQLQVDDTHSETYVRDSLALGDVFVTVYRLESLSAEDALDRLIPGFESWVANRHGGSIR